MEVGIACLAAVEPLQTRTDIIEEELIALLSPECMVEELSHEQGDGQLRRIGLQGGVGEEDVHIMQTLHLLCGSEVGLYI